MEYGAFYEETGQPFTGRKRAKLEAFLKQAELRYDEGVEYTVNLVDREGNLAATGSVQRNILKCIAVAEQAQGEGLTARIVTALMNRAMEQGRKHLFLFTKPKNRAVFQDLGFYPITQTADILLMENQRNGIGRYVRSLSRGAGQGTAGAVVANCNPFTLGHRYLIEQAAAQCDTLHVFILSEDRSLFPARVRYELAQKGLADLSNVVLHETSDYLISSVVFPTYFMKDQARAREANCELDIRIFCTWFAKELGITKRFVGTEPFCPVTKGYNRAMKQILPEYGIQLVEIPRREKNGRAISATAVREAMKTGDMESLEALVPASTLAYIRSPEGQKLAQNLRTGQETP